MSRTETVVDRGPIDLSEIDDKIKTIVKNFEPERIVLFGSYASGNPSPDSDVDLLVIIATERPTLDLAVEISLAVKHSFPMDIIVRTPQAIAKRLKCGDFFIKNIMENGKVLYERNSQ